MMPAGKQGSGGEGSEVLGSTRARVSRGWKQAGPAPGLCPLCAAGAHQAGYLLFCAHPGLFSLPSFHSGVSAAAAAQPPRPSREEAWGHGHPPSPAGTVPPTP